ncbi:mechanosensitive ion channel protein 6-like [Telopea speciosissima]|uniref:mechanosensitive ion channel protein 6-like n=1 Tax=Telopea speciosissima TaxID=54955 RepID=UPI001CC7C2B1|nr:mechanosensitive ion channel protein 6-like [Telopea speciosissima]
MSSEGVFIESPSKEKPIISISNNDDHLTKSVDPSHHGEFVVKIDGNNNACTKDVDQVWKESSYDFWKEGVMEGRGGSNAGQQQGGEDPPSRLIEQFLNKQKAAGEMSLDMELEMEELQIQNDRSLPPIAESPTDQLSRDLKVSFQEPSRNRIEISSDPIRRPDDYDEEKEKEKQHHQQLPPRPKSWNSDGRSAVLRCTSNASFRPNSGMLRTRTKSRLIDPVEESERRSFRSTTPPAKSGMLKSGLSGKVGEEEEEDPFFLEDIPEEFRKGKLSVLALLEWISLVLILAVFIASITVPRLEKKLVWSLHLWKWEMLILVLICGRLVSGWAIRIAVFFIECNFLLRKRVLYFVYGVRRAVRNCIWLGLVLIVWYAMLGDKVRQSKKAGLLLYVTMILVCLLVSTLIWLVKTLLVKVLASSFHVSTYFDRIQDSLFNQYVIETLSGPPWIEIQQTHEENEKCMAEVQQLQDAGATMPADLRTAACPSIRSGRVIGSGRLQKNTATGTKSFRHQDEGITIDHLHKLNQKNVSAWNMKRLINIVRLGVLSTLDERILDSTQYRAEESNTQIRSEYEAKIAAKKIFRNVAKPDSKYIYLQDFMRFMREDEALKTMSLFEGANDTKRISRFSLKNWVVNAFRERRALALTLNDTKTAVNKLHHMLDIIVIIIIIVIWLLILGIATTHFFVLISSQLLLVVFIFGNTCKTVFESIIFLFAMHPFDVGDRCLIDGVQMIVEEMNILTTVFLRFDNLKITYPNTQLAQLPISNFYRSPDMGDSIDFCVHVSTPLEKIDLMKQRILRYADRKEDHWCPGSMVVLRDVEDMNRLKISVWVTHRINHQDMGERWIRREPLVEEIIKTLKELDIEYRMLPVDINLRNMPSINSTRLPSTWTTCGN